MKGLGYQLLNKGIAIFLIAIFIGSSIPLGYGQEVRGGGTKELDEEEATSIGEDIIINVDTYQPKVIRTSLLEDQNVIVYASLRGIPTNPSITIPRIRNIMPSVTAIKTKPEGKKVGIGSVQYINPRTIVGLTGASSPFTDISAPFVSTGFGEEPDFYNLGYLAIPINRIEKEEDVPDEIRIDMLARISLDVSEGLTFSRFSDVLPEQTFDEWRKRADQHRFFGGFIRASEVKDDQASFQVYDNSLNDLTPRAITLRKGESSATINPNTGYIPGLFNRFTIKLNDIKLASDKVNLIVYKDNEQLQKTLTRGQSLYDGSEWFLDDVARKVVSGKEVFEVTFRNVVTKSTLRRAISCLLNDCKAKPKTVEIAETKLQEQIRCSEITNENQCAQRKDCSWFADIPGVEGSCTIAGDSVKSGSADLSVALAEFTSAKQEKKEDYDQFVERFKQIVNNEGNHQDVRNNAREQLRNIKLLYNDLRIGAIKEKNTEKEAEFSNRILNIDDFLRREEEIRTTAIIKEPREASDLYKNAISEYEQVTFNYAGIKDERGEFYAARAQLRIAEIYETFLGDETRAAAEYKKLLENYPGSKVYNEPVVRNRIKILEGLVGNTNIATFELEDAGRTIRVTVFGIDELSQEEVPKADIELSEIDANGRKSSISRKTIKLNQQVVQEASSEWILNEVGVEKIEIRKIERETGRILETKLLARNEARVISAGGKSINLLFLGARDVRKEAHITIEPLAERALTQASFTLKLPIEKRPFDLPLFSESLDKEIVKTEELIEKLDKVIDNIKKLHEFWINTCYVTFGALWTKNLLQGGTKVLARQKIRDKWQDNYRADLGSGKFSGTFDQYLIQNNKAYSSDLNAAQGIIQRISKNEYSLPEELKSVDKDSVNDWLFYRELSKQDKSYLDKFVDLDFNVRTLQRVDADIEVAVNRFEELAKNNDGEKIKQELEAVGIVRPDSQSYKNFLTYYQQNKGNVLTQYRQIRRKQELNKFFKPGEGYENWKKGLEEFDMRLPVEEDSRFAEKFRAREANLFPDTQFESLSQSSLFFDKGENGFLINLIDKRENLPLYLTEADCKASKALLNSYAKGKEYYYKEKDACKRVKIGEETITPTSYLKKISLAGEGPNKGRVEFISIDSIRYAQLVYTAGGAVKSVDIFQRAKPNTPLGGPGFREGEINDVLKSLKESKLEGDKSARTSMERVRGEALKCNRALKSSYRKGDKVCGDYVLEEAAPAEITGSCVDYMDPVDCRLLFNACDPVICPTSRCNLGGRWSVKNVVETGLIGSTVLCAPNFPEVVMPVCITGILAGLQNIKSILQGYGECLKVQKVAGKSVGICDRIRNVFVCEILWREAIAIFNVKGGLIGYLSDKIFDRNSGGGEYATFRQSVDNSVGSLKFFTQTYAQNVFAAYQGGSLDEIGTEICKSAIFGEVPGVGDFFDQISRPQSPPQFIAFFDEIPFSDIPRIPQSQYSIFYHIYAGETEEVRYSVFLRGQDTSGRKITRFIVRGRPLDKGEFANANLDRVYETGFNEICVEISTLNLGTRLECGFGKVTTDFGVNYLTDVFTARDALKKISSAEECIPESGRLTDLAYRASRVEGKLDVGRAAVGSFSTGLTQTGILRKCSLHNPGVGANEESWAPVGTCGFDERKRDLGTCWLYKPLVGQLIKDTERESETLDNLQKRSQELQESGILGRDVIPDDLVTREDGLLVQAVLFRSEGKFVEAINIFKDIVRRAVNQNLRAQAQFEIAVTYERWGESKRIELKSKEIAKAVKPIKDIPAPKEKVEPIPPISERITEVVKKLFEALKPDEPVETEARAKEKLEPTDEIASPKEKVEPIPPEQVTGLETKRKIVLNPECPAGQVLAWSSSTFSIAEGISNMLNVELTRKNEDGCIDETQLISLINERSNKGDILLTVELTPYTNKIEYASSSGLLLSNYLKSYLGEEFELAFSNRDLMTKTEPVAIKVNMGANKVIQESREGFVKGTVDGLNSYLHWIGLGPARRLAFKKPPLADKSYLDIISAFTTNRDLKLLTPAVIYQESNFNTFAVSTQGAVGLMQLLPATARELGLKVPQDAGRKCKNVGGIIGECDAKEDERFIPEKNIRAGITYLNKQLNNFNRDEKLALAAYNAGPSNVNNALKNCQSKYGNRDFDTCREFLPRETQDYVSKVIESKETFRAVIG